MKILHINSNYLFTTLHQELIKKLRKYKHSHSVYMPVHNKAKFVIEPENDVHVSVSFKKINRYSFFYKQKKIFNDVIKLFDLKKFELIHAHTLFTDGYLAYKLNKIFNIPYVVTIRNTDINIFFNKRFYLRKTGIKILNSATKIVFLSDSYYDQLKQRYLPIELHKKMNEKVHIVPNGISSFWLDNKSSNLTKQITNEIKLIYVGRIDKNKNIYTSVKACEILILKGYKVRLTIVGPIADKNEYKKWANKPFVEYYDKQPREDLIKMYRESDIFVMPSIYESFGLVYAEAMSQSLPIIYSKGQGFDKQFDDGVVGYSVESLNERDIAEKIILVIDNYFDLSKNCTALCEKFDWNKISEEYNAIYENSL